jgi:signal transduction histidine kinase/CheY-like chemotaxis protein
MSGQINHLNTIYDLLKYDERSLAVADKNKKIVWFNKKFKDDCGLKRLKGAEISGLFNSDPALKKIKYTNKSTVNLEFTSLRLIITVIKVKNKIEGYLLNAEPLVKIKKTEVAYPDSKSLLFPKTLSQILTLLVKEKSLSVLAEKILQMDVLTVAGNIGIIIFHNEDPQKGEFQFYDPGNEINNREEIEKEILASSSYINKWLLVNKHSLLLANSSDSIGFQIKQAIQCKSIIISPCFFDDKLLASIIIGRKDECFSAADAENAEQFAALLSYTISNNRTRELNTTLESRLLQSQKLETIGKLSSGMAHDFSNLLSSIFGSINLLKKRISDKEDAYRLLDNIENCSIRARDLTRGLLSFGKPTPKRRELIKPNMLFSEISKVITQTFPAKIAFESHVQENLHDILGDSTEVYQVILNLCVNAKEAIPDKGKITLTAENININDSNIENHPLLENGNYLWFSLKDSGSGIKEENLIKIFDPYFSTKDKQSGSGSGLGLYVTYGIIKAHKGQIEVSSIINQGTTFDVFIPAFEPKSEDKKVSADKIILLADDETMLRDLLAELLESSGYNVIKVSSGTEALKVLTEEIKVDLAIIDYNMPEMDGLTCIKKIRELKFDMHIILSSGSFHFEDNFDYKKAGITAMLSKPYEFETMLSTIQKLI